jgi:hypothetical protein
VNLVHVSLKIVVGDVLVIDCAPLEEAVRFDLLSFTMQESVNRLVLGLVRRLVDNFRLLNNVVVSNGRYVNIWD